MAQSLLEQQSVQNENKLEIQKRDSEEFMDRAVVTKKLHTTKDSVVRWKGNTTGMLRSKKSAALNTQDINQEGTYIGHVAIFVSSIEQKEHV